MTAASSTPDDLTDHGRRFGVLTRFAERAAATHSDEAGAFRYDLFDPHGHRVALVSHRDDTAGVLRLSATEAVTTVAASCLDLCAVTFTGRGYLCTDPTVASTALMRHALEHGTAMAANVREALVVVTANHDYLATALIPYDRDPDNPTGSVTLCWEEARTTYEDAQTSITSDSTGAFLAAQTDTFVPVVSTIRDCLRATQPGLDGPRGTGDELSQATYDVTADTEALFVLAGTTQACAEPARLGWSLIPRTGEEAELLDRMGIRHAYRHETHQAS